MGKAIACKFEDLSPEIQKAWVATDNETHLQSLCVCGKMGMGTHRPMEAEEH